MEARIESAGAKRMRKRLLVGALLGAVTLATSGCFMILALGVEFVDDNSELVDKIFDAIDTKATLSICSPFIDHVECRFFIDGNLVGSTAQFGSEFGIIGGAIVDPVVLELPAAVTDIAGTFDDGAGHSGNLVVYPNLSYVPADDTKKFVAGPGKQLAIVDVPAGTPVNGVTYDFHLTFKQEVAPGTGPTQFKAVMTGRVPVNGRNFYPPFLPCTTD